jgi:hypothetical protein
MNWWDNEKKLHPIPGSARVDPEAECFFELVDEDGNVDTTSKVDPSTIEFVK